VRGALAWLLTELLQELEASPLGSLVGELVGFNRRLDEGMEGEELLTAEEFLVKRVHQARDEADDAAGEEEEAAAFAAAGGAGLAR